MEIFYIVLVVFACFHVSVNSQNPFSPCPQIFRYENDGYRWFGTIEAPNPPPYGSEMTLKIRMAIRALLPTNYVGKIELAEDRDVVLLKIAQTLPIKYKVTFPLASPLPSVMKISFAGKILCTGDPVYGRIITAVDLEHTLHSGESALKNGPKESLVIGGTIPTQIPWLGATDSPPEINIRNQFLSEADAPPRPAPQLGGLVNSHRESICGTVKVVNPLIVNGDFAAKGDWPWMVAIFLKKPRGLEFICAGSLISDNKVLTAGHCVKKRSSIQIKPEDLVLKLGVHNIQDWTEETAVTKSVSHIKVHEEYDVGAILNNDIAVLTLSQPVTFTNYIRPVCLWLGDTDLDKVVGKTATVVGWGKDEKGAPATAEPKVSTVPIVSTTTCKASRVEFFKLTSDTTLCAGAKDGSGPCNGDSGGGLFMRQGGRWTLRGIVSKSLKDPETYSCDLNEYVVYTDAAKFADFIR